MVPSQVGNTPHANVNMVGLDRAFGGG